MSLEAALDRNTAAVQSLIALLAGLQAPPSTAGQEAPAPNKPASQVAPSKPARQAPAPAAGTPSAPAPAPATAFSVTLDDVRKAVIDLVKFKGRDAAVALLQEYGAGAAGEVNEAQYTDFVTEARARIAA